MQDVSDLCSICDSALVCLQGLPKPGFLKRPNPLGFLGAKPGSLKWPRFIGVGIFVGFKYLE